MVKPDDTPIEIDWTEPEAVRVARCLLWLAAQESPPRVVGATKLQKLLYYVQGWSLALRGRPAFSQKLKAWNQGPVEPGVFHRFKEAGFTASSQGAKPEGLSDEDVAFIASIWSDYKRFTPDQLVRMTHEEAPWRDTFEPDSEGRCNKEIPPGLVESHFRSLLGTRLSNDDLVRLAGENKPPDAWFDEPL